MKKLDEYLELQQEIYDYFGYKEDWRVIPIDDRREMYWRLIPNYVEYWKTEENVGRFLDDDGYQDEIYTQRHLPKWVYRGKEYTMICVDTHTDGNQFLAIYDNKKEVNYGS